MANSGFEWIVSPLKLSPEYEKYGHRVLVGLFASFAAWGEETQEAARLNAQTAWDTRTGAALSGIFYPVDGLGMKPEIGMLKPNKVDPKSLEGKDKVEVKGNSNTLVVVLAHTVYYGKYLELSHGGRHGVIVSTMEQRLPILEDLLKRVFP